MTMKRIEQLLSFQDVGSQLSRLNASTGSWVALSAESIRVLTLALAMARASGELFNCTVAGALIAKGLLPNHGGNCLPMGSSADLEIRSGYARLHRPVRIVLDGIAKGYAVDRAVQQLKRAGFGSGWINAGGDARAFGQIPLYLQRRELDGSLRAVGGLRDAAVASSVTRARRDEGFASHVVGPATGGKHDEVVTVMARTAWRADALTKVAALIAPAQRAELIGRLGGRLIVPALAQAA